MKRLGIYMAVLALFASGAAASAQQDLRSGYFLDGYAYRYKFNPAFQGERGFVAIPAIGRTGIGVESNFAMSDFVYTLPDGQSVSFMHSDVSETDFLGNIKRMNKLALNIDAGILSTGFRVGKSYHTIDMSVRADLGVNLPKSLFEFAKGGADGGRNSYEINNLGAKLDSRMEIAYGYSRSITQNLYIGGRIKFLVGAARASIAMDRMNIELSGNKLRVNAEGNMSTSGLLEFMTNGEAGTSENASTDNMIAFQPSLAADAMSALSNLGAAADLGVTWNFLKYFTLSASVLDLGFISWTNTAKAATPGTGWEFEGFEEGAELEEIGESLLNMLNFERTQSGTRSTEGLAATAHLGLEARMPFYENLSFGLLGTRRFDGQYSWTEGRLSMNIAPLKWLSLTGSYAFSDFGHSAGAALALHMKGFNLCIGTDSLLPVMHMSPSGIPADNWNTNVTFSLSFEFGKFCKAN